MRQQTGPARPHGEEDPILASNDIETLAGRLRSASAKGGS